MIVYNVTTNVTWAIHDEWLQWLRQVYIPRVLQTSCFSESRILRLFEIDDEDGPTYAVQFHASTIENYHRFIEHHSASFQQQSREKWQDQLISISSVMEVLH